MIEILDNSLQLAVAIGCTVWSAIGALKLRSKSYFAFTCFNGSFALGLLYWLLFLIINKQKAMLIYVPGLSWTASYVFLAMVLQGMIEPGERDFHPPLAWLYPLFGAAALVFLTHFREILPSLTITVMTGITGYLSIRGLLWARRSPEGKSPKLTFYALLLPLLFIKCILWMLSSSGVAENHLTLYFVIDYLITLGHGLLTISFRRAAPV